VLDITIYYPDGIPTFVDFLWGRMRRVVVKARMIEVPSAQWHGDYGTDADFRAGFSAWVAQVWREKDAQLLQLEKQYPPR
jgi:hypothetical protein